MLFLGVGDFTGDLYPYRWPIAIATVIGVMALLAIAYRLRWYRTVWAHKFISAAALVAFLVVAVPVGDYLISPLFERSTLCEASPLSGAGAGSGKCAAAALAMADTSDMGMHTTAAASSGVSATAATATAPAANAPATDAPATAAPATAPTSAAPTAPTFAARVVLQGQFRGADDFHFGEGKALVIETAPGRYILRFEDFSVRNGPDLFVYLSPNPDGQGDGAINLGDLKATDGAFNYDIPAGTDLAPFKSAIVYCKQFSELFATATFVPA